MIVMKMWAEVKVQMCARWDFYLTLTKQTIKTDYTQNQIREYRRLPLSCILQK